MGLRFPVFLALSAGLAVASARAGDCVRNLENEADYRSAYVALFGEIRYDGIVDKKIDWYDRDSVARVQAELKTKKIETEIVPEHSGSRTAYVLSFSPSSNSSLGRVAKLIREKSDVPFVYIPDELGVLRGNPRAAVGLRQNGAIEERLFKPNVTFVSIGTDELQSLLRANKSSTPSVLRHELVHFDTYQRIRSKKLNLFQGWFDGVDLPDYRGLLDLSEIPAQMESVFSDLQAWKIRVLKYPDLGIVNPDIVDRLYRLVQKCEYSRKFWEDILRRSDADWASLPVHSTADGAYITDFRVGDAPGSLTALFDFRPNLSPDQLRKSLRSYALKQVEFLSSFMSMAGKMNLPPYSKLVIYQDDEVMKALETLDENKQQLRDLFKNAYYR